MKLGKGILFGALLIGVCSVVNSAEVVKKVTDFNVPGEWKPYQWNKATGKISVRPEFPDELKGKGDEETSLGLKISWPGGEGMRFFTIVPEKQVTIPFKVSKGSIWIKGTSNGRYLELHFLANGQEKDDKGKLYKLGGPGAFNFDNWRKHEFTIPADWPQPLTIKSVTFHDWGCPQPAEDTFYITRYEFTCDDAQKLGDSTGAAAGGQKAKTNDAW